jgi:hypothetical protein
MGEITPGYVNGRPGGLILADRALLYFPGGGWMLASSGMSSMVCNLSRDSWVKYATDGEIKNQIFSKIIEE